MFNDLIHFYFFAKRIFAYKNTSNSLFMYIHISFIYYFIYLIYDDCNDEDDDSNLIRLRFGGDVSNLYFRLVLACLRQVFNPPPSFVRTLLINLEKPHLNPG